MNVKVYIVQSFEKTTSIHQKNTYIPKASGAMDGMMVLKDSEVKDGENVGVEVILNDVYLKYVNNAKKKKKDESTVDVRNKKPRARVSRECA